MISTLPDWHPVFVHFTAALFSASVILFLVAHMLSERPITDRFLQIAHWTLWLCAILTLLTIALGIYAFYTVAHDISIDLATIESPHWALPSAMIILLLAVWSGLQYRAQRQPSNALVISLIIGLITLGFTVWHGGGVVQRHHVTDNAPLESAPLQPPLDGDEQMM